MKPIYFCILITLLIVMPEVNAMRRARAMTAGEDVTDLFPEETNSPRITMLLDSVNEDGCDESDSTDDTETKTTAVATITTQGRPRTPATPNNKNKETKALVVVASPTKSITPDFKDFISPQEMVAKDFAWILIPTSKHTSYGYGLHKNSFRIRAILCAMLFNTQPFASSWKRLVTHGGPAFLGSILTLHLLSRAAHETQDSLAFDYKPIILRLCALLNHTLCQNAGTLLENFFKNDTPSSEENTHRIGGISGLLALAKVIVPLIHTPQDSAWKFVAQTLPTTMRTNKNTV